MREKFFKEIKQFKGLNLSRPKTEIEDNEFSYVLNASFEGGVAQKREGVGVADFRNATGTAYSGAEREIEKMYLYGNDIIVADNVNVYVFRIFGSFPPAYRRHQLVSWAGSREFCFMDNNKDLYLDRVGEHDSPGWVNKLRFAAGNWSFVREPLVGQQGPYSFLTTAVRRLFYGRVGTDGLANNRISFSEVVNNANLPVNSFRVVHPSIFQVANDIITGIVGMQNKVIIFQKEGMFVLNCEGDPIDWVLSPVMTNFGMIRPYAYAIVEGNIIFLSRGGLKIFDGTNVSDFPKFPTELFDTLGVGFEGVSFSNTLRDFAEPNYLSYDRLEKKLYLPLEGPSNIQGTKTHFLVYDFAHDYWTIYTGLYGYGRILRVDSQHENRLLMGETIPTLPAVFTVRFFIKEFVKWKFSDEVVNQTNQNIVDKVAINFSLKSKRYSIDSPHFQKDFQRIYLTTNCNAGTLAMRVIVSDINRIEFVQDFVINTRTTPGTTPTSTMIHEILFDEKMYGRFIEFEFTNNVIDEHVEIHSIVIEGEMEYYSKR